MAFIFTLFPIGLIYEFVYPFDIFVFKFLVFQNFNFVFYFFPYFEFMQVFFFRFFVQLLTTANQRNNPEVPNAKRFRNSDCPKGEIAFTLSQPVPQIVRDIAKNDDVDEQRNDFCFSQPTLMEDLILCTQMNPTQSTQNPFHRLVKRMTRFSVKTSSEEAIQRITDTVSQMGYTWKPTDKNLFTVSTIDRRKIQLIFKINLIEMNNAILVDFRLSKGDGIEFKRRFIQIKKLLTDIIDKEQHSW